LTDTYWEHSVALNNPQPVSLSINMPISKSATISKVDGIVFTSSPVNIMMKAYYADPNKPTEIRIKSSRKDYDAFSFVIPADTYKSIELVLFKSEPDKLGEDSVSPYIYSFGLRELIVGSKYYAQNGILISSPISLPVKNNSNLVIDAVALEVNEQVVPGTSISYYVAPEVSTAQNVSDFNWIPISPKGSENSGHSSLVYMNGATKNSLYISNSPTAEEIPYIPITTTSQNINEINPNSKLYLDKNVYRIAALNYNTQYVNPTLYGNVDCFKHNYIVHTEIKEVNFKYKDLQYWSSARIDKPSDYFTNILKEQVGTITPGINTIASRIYRN
jgi:hypothetical protein